MMCPAPPSRPPVLARSRSGGAEARDVPVEPAECVSRGQLHGLKGGVTHKLRRLYITKASVTSPVDPPPYLKGLKKEEEEEVKGRRRRKKKK